MLIRRLKERCAAPHLVHVGTSATMVASPDATPESRRDGGGLCRPAVRAPLALPGR